MNDTLFCPDDVLSVEASLRLDAICERFEDVWIAGRRPCLEQMLAGTEGVERAALLHELLQLELDYRRRRGEEAPLNEYESRFPNDVAVVRAAFAVAHAPSTLSAPRRQPTAGHRPPPAKASTSQTLTTPERTEAEKPSWGNWRRDTPFPQLPGYEVLEELGRGGMGVVYKARQTALKRLAALKMILAGDFAAPEEILRFRTEAEAIARLCHPNIVQVYEVGEHAGQPYFSMEYVDGGNLSTKLRESLPEPKAAARLIETLALAVHAMHECQVVHRDLKPANVLLTRDNTPKVSDFGLAKKLDEDTGQTQPGVVMGTPSYMAPEQAEGRGTDVGPLTDVYALGAVLYESLTGRPPFRAATRQETLRQVIEKEVMAPRQLNPAVPRDLEIIGLKCLQKDPARRYASALELADDLRRYLDGRPIHARPTPPSERAIRWARSRPTLAALAVAVVVAVLGGLFGVTSYALYMGKNADLARQKTADLEKRIRMRKQIDDYAGSAEEDERNGRPDDALKHLVEALALIKAEPGIADDDLSRLITERHDRVRRRVLEGKDRQQLTERITRFEDFRRDVQHYTISFADRNPEAARAVVRRKAEDALAEFGFSADDTPADAGKRLEAFRGSYANAQEANTLAAECYEVLLAWAEAEAPLKPAPAGESNQATRKVLHLLDMAAAVASAHHLAVPQAFHLRRARQLAVLGRDEEARAEREVAAGVAPDTVLDLFLAGLEAYRLGQLERAATACNRVLLKKPDHFWARYLLALCHHRAGEWQMAKDLLTACLGARPDFFWPRLFLASAECALGDIPAAEADFKTVLGKVGDDLLGRWLVRVSRGALRVQQKRWDDALVDLEEAIRLRPEAVEAYVTLAQAHAKRERYAAAVAVLSRALERHPDDPELYHNRAQMHMERGDSKAARADFEQAIAHERHVGSVPQLVSAVLSPAAPKSAREPGYWVALRLANDYVQLAHLQDRNKEYVAALVSCAAALLIWPDYPPAHYQRAQTLYAVKNYAAAGAALDRYLRRSVPTAGVYQARGMIHAQLHEYQKAVEAYDRAVRIRPDAPTLAYCGWAYLKLDALQPALNKFEAALKLEATNADALCGRGLARVRLGDVRGALEDAEAAQNLDSHKPELLFQTACIYAQAARRVDAQGAVIGNPAAQYRERSVKLLSALMGRMPEREREAYWHDRIESEPALDPIRRSNAYFDLARAYSR